ncbi:Uncharacterised protein [Streptococcus pneumoniae]|nr:Uncharacterised protein [Streptococcus pneumoniae]
MNARAIGYSSMYPYPPKSCRQRSTTLFCMSLAKNFTMEASAAVSVPSTWATMHWSTRVRVASVSATHSARTNCVFWKDISGSPNA